MGATRTAEVEAATDDLHEWAWQGPAKMEIEELVPLKNEYEIQEGIKMSREGIVNFIEEMVQQESPKTSDQWHNRLDLEDCRMSMRDGGSKHNNSTFFRVDSEFDKTWKLENLVSVMYDEAHVPQWDPMISHNEFQPLRPGNKTIGTNWTKHHRIMHVSSREYCDKMINFYHNGKFYHYQTSIPTH